MTPPRSLDFVCQSLKTNRKLNFQTFHHNPLLNLFECPHVNCVPHSYVPHSLCVNNVNICIEQGNIHVQKFKYTKTTRFNRKKLEEIPSTKATDENHAHGTMKNTDNLYICMHELYVHKMIYAIPRKIIIIKCITWECTDKYRVIYPQYLIVFVIYCCQWEWVSVCAYVLFPSQQSNYQTEKPPQMKFRHTKYICASDGTLCSVLNIVLYGIGCTLYNVHICTIRLCTYLC